MIRSANCFVRSLRSFSSFIILISNLAGGDAFADLVGELADDGPDGLLGLPRGRGGGRSGRSVVFRCAKVLRSAFGFGDRAAARSSVVGLGELPGFLARTDLGGDAVQLVVEDVAETFGEDQRKDVVLVFRCVLGPANGSRRCPRSRIRRIWRGRCWWFWASAYGVTVSELQSAGTCAQGRLRANPA